MLKPILICMILKSFMIIGYLSESTLGREIEDYEPEKSSKTDAVS